MTVSLLGHTVAPLYVAGLGWVSREIACERFRPRYNGPPCNRCIRCHVLEDATPEECVFERDGVRLFLTASPSGWAIDSYSIGYVAYSLPDGSDWTVLGAGFVQLGFLPSARFRIDELGDVVVAKSVRRRFGIDVRPESYDDDMLDELAYDMIAEAIALKRLTVHGLADGPDCTTASCVDLLLAAHDRSIALQPFLYDVHGRAYPSGWAPSADDYRRSPRIVPRELVDRAICHEDERLNNEPLSVFYDSDSSCAAIIVTGSSGRWHEPSGGVPIYAQCGYVDDEPWYDITTYYRCAEHGGIHVDDGNE